MSVEDVEPLADNDPWLMLLRRHEVPTWIRATSRYGFRSGSWALLLGSQIVSAGREQRPCWQVMFPDGACDLWPCLDKWENYEFVTHPEKPADD